MGWYLRDHPPFTSLVEELAPESVVESLHLIVVEVTLGLELRGLSRKFLEEKAWDLENEWKWLPSSAILALLIIGVIMFPIDDYYMDPSTINKFLSRYLVSASHQTREEEGCIHELCISIVLLLLSHIPQKGLWIEFLKDLKWSQKQASLTSDAIVWYLLAYKVDQVVTTCGEFLNVPLTGPRGCIN